MAKTLDKIRDEDEIVKAVTALYQEAKDAAAERHKQIEKCWRFYFGQQWLDKEGKPDKKAPRWRFRGVRDICFQTVEGLRPLLHNGRPQVFVTADFEQDKHLAEIATEILDAEYEFRGEAVRLGKLILDILVAGVGIEKIVYDFRSNMVRAIIIDPTSFYPDPYGQAPDFSDHQYVIHEIEMDASQIERQFGISEKEFGGEPGAGGTGIFSLVRKIFGGEGVGIYERRRYPVWDVYYNEATPAEIMNTQKEPKSLRYPRGRHLVIVNGKKVVLDEENPYRHGDFPFVSFHDYTIPRSFWSLGELDNLMPIQVSINVLFSQLIMNAILTSNAQWIYPKGAIPRGSLTNEPGLMIPVDPRMVDKVRRVEPGRIPAGLTILMRDLEEHAQRVSSVTDVMLGREPKAGTSGIAIQGLQTAAMGRVRFKIINLDESLRRQARLEFALIQDYADFEDPRYTRKLGFGEWLLWTEDIRNLLYDIDVESKSELPHSIEGRLNFALKMLEVGAFDLIDFIDYVGVPVREEYKELLKKQFEAMLAQFGGIPQSQGTPKMPRDHLADLLGIPNLGQGVEGGERALRGLLR